MSTDIGGFGSLGLDARLLESIAALGYEEPTPIQREAVPPLLAGSDLIGQAATGTGKTAAFALPLLQRVQESETMPSALVLVPTRELAMQVSEAIHRYGKALGARVLPIYGGAPFTQQLRALQRGVDVVVATPGRALDHARRGTLPLSGLRIVVLDEADEMLDMGFAEDLEAILSQTPTNRQTVLFSATLPPRILSVAKRHLRDPVQITIARERTTSGTVPRIRQTAYVVSRAHKIAALGRVLDLESPTAALVFCRMRTEVDELTETLNARGYRAEALHGGMSQEQRDRVMGRLRGGTADLLIATDVAARGLDVEHLTHVINYDVPTDPDAYVHRIGRVGRAGRGGVAITFAEPREHRLLRNIEHATKSKLEMAHVPTVADLRARRLDVTRASLEELLISGDLDDVRVVVETLSTEHDIMDIALAAVKLAHQATDGATTDETEIPVPTLFATRGSEKPKSSRDRGRKERRVPGDDSMARIWIGAGREAGIRPQDLVGAITNEAGVRGSEIGAIEITDRFSLVEVSEDIIEDVLAAMRRTKIKGQKVLMRRDREGSPAGETRKRKAPPKTGKRPKRK